MRQDEVLYKIADKVKNFAVIYVCDIDRVPDFNVMYELYDPCTVMFFFVSIIAPIPSDSSPQPFILTGSCLSLHAAKQTHHVRSRYR